MKIAITGFEISQFECKIRINLLTRNNYDAIYYFLNPTGLHQQLNR